MKHFKFITALILLIASTCTIAEDSTNSVKMKLLLEKSGLKAQASMYSEIFEASFEQQKNSIQNDDVFNLMIKANRAGNSENRIYKILESNMLNTMTDQEIEKILVWLDTPLGKKITDIEIAATTPEQVKIQYEYLANKKNLMVSSKREKLINRLIETNNSVEDANLINTVLLDNLLLSFKTQMGSDKDAIANLEKQFEDIKIKLKAETKLLLYNTFIFTYKDITDEELALYIKMLGSPESKKFDKKLSEAHIEAFSIYSKVFADTFTEGLQKLKASEEE